MPAVRRRRTLAHSVLITAMSAALALPGVSVLGSLAPAVAVETVAEASPAELVVAPATPVLDVTASEFRFEALLRNPGDDPLPAGSVVISIDNLPLENVAGVDENVRSDALEAGRVTVVETAAQGEQRVEIVVQRADFPLLFTRSPGVYSLRATYAPRGVTANTDGGADAAADDGTLEAMTPVIWGRVDTVAPVPVTLVVPLVLPTAITTLPSREQLIQIAPTLRQLLDAAEQQNATIAVDPRIIAATRALGTTAPTSARTLVERLERTSSPVFLLQFADADPAAQAALGFDSLLAPIGLDSATRSGVFERTEQAAPSDPTTGQDEQTNVQDEQTNTEVSDTTEAEADAGGATLTDVPGAPPLTELLTLSNARPGAWPAGGEVDSATLGLLQGAGLTSLVLESTNVSGATGTNVTVDGFHVLVADSNLIEANRNAIGGPTLTEQAAGSAMLASRLALAAQSGSPGAVLALDRAALADSADPLQILQQLDGMTWVQTVPEDSQVAGTAQLRAGATTEDRRELLQQIMTRSAQIDALAPLLEYPEYLIEYQRERLLEAFATRYAEPGVDLAAVDALVQERDEQLLQGVRPITTESTQLVGTSSRVPVTLNNALPFDAAVSVHVTPLSAAISVPERDFSALVPAEGSVNILVPVKSRVSSGESGLNLEVRSASGEYVFGSTLQQLTLRTAIESIMLGILGSAAALLLGFGVWRSIRRRRSGVTGTGTLSLPGTESPDSKE